MMKNLTSLLLIYLFASTAWAKQYTYHVTVINKTSNATIFALDNSARPPISKTPISPKGGSKTFTVTDNGKSFQVWATNKNICVSPGGQINMLDFTMFLDNFKNWKVTITGGFQSGGYSFNCTSGWL